MHISIHIIHRSRCLLTYLDHAREEREAPEAVVVVVLEGLVAHVPDAHQQRADVRRRRLGHVVQRRHLKTNERTNERITLQNEKMGERGGENAKDGGEKGTDEKAATRDEVIAMMKKHKDAFHNKKY